MNRLSAVLLALPIAAWAWDGENRYGPGVGKDQYGRPVRARGLDGRLLEPLSVPDDER